MYGEGILKCSIAFNASIKFQSPSVLQYSLFTYRRLVILFLKIDHCLALDSNMENRKESIGSLL